MASPIYLEVTSSSHAGHDGEAIVARIAKLEDEVTELHSTVSELRETIARFADVMIGEVKDLKQSHGDILPIPQVLVDNLPALSITEDRAGEAVAPPSDAPADIPAPRQPWLLTGIFRDLGTSLRMYLDPRYRVRRPTQFIVPILIATLVMSYVFFNMVFTLAVVSTILEKIVDALVVIVLFQILHREVVHYRLILAQLQQWQGRRSRSVVTNEEAHPRMEIES